MKAGATKPIEAEKAKKFFYSANDIDKPCSSPSEPNVDHTVRSVCTQIHKLLDHSVRHHKKNPKVIPVFCEDLHSLGVTDMTQIPLPQIEHMHIFMVYIMHQLQMNPQCSIICLIYLERLITDAKVVLHPINWRRLVVISLLMASKVWEDHSVRNAAIVQRAFPFFTVKEINVMEQEFLELLDFNLTITPQEYLEYYFSLRELCGADFLAKLKKEELELLETKSKQQSRTAASRPKSIDESALSLHVSSLSSSTPLPSTQTTSEPARQECAASSSASPSSSSQQQPVEQHASSTTSESDATPSPLNK